MTNFQEMIVDSFIWSKDIDTIININGRIHCNPDWWMKLSQGSKIKFLEHEIKHM